MLSFKGLSAGFPRAARRLVAAALLALAASGGAATAQAGAVYSTSVAATLTIDSFGAGPGFTVSGAAAPVADAPDYATFDALLFTGNDLSGAFAFGDATANKSATAQVNAADANAMVAGDSLHQSASVGGSAGTPDAYSVALQLTTGLLTLVNGSGSNVTVSLTLDYLWSISATAGDIATEFAESFFNVWAAFYLDEAWVADLHVAGDQPGQYVQTWIDGNLSSLGNAGSATFDVTIPTGAVGKVALFVDAEGYAETISEPGSIAPLGLVLAAIGVARRRRPTGA